MNIDKSQIVELLKSRGDHDKAQQAQSELPDQVDTERTAPCCRSWVSTRASCSVAAPTSAASSVSESKL